MKRAGSAPPQPDREHRIRPKHSLGQNFLSDPAELVKVVEAAEIRATDEVLEIGSGTGSLTHLLAARARRVVSVEIDPQLASICRDSVGAFPNVDVVNGDILSLDPSALGIVPGFLVVANIPYYITSAILRYLLEGAARPRRLVLTVQREVAARVAAAPPDMSLLAVSVQVHGAAHVVDRIPASAFRPRPKVDSAILRVDCFDEPVVGWEALSVFFRTVKAGFLQPRKMLRNSLAAGLALSPAETASLLRLAGIDGQRRAQTMSIPEWHRLALGVMSRSRL